MNDFNYCESKKRPWYLKLLFKVFSIRSLKLFSMRLDNMIYAVERTHELQLRKKCEADVKEFLKHLPNVNLESSPLEVYPMGAAPHPINLEELRRLDKTNAH
jgi:hypothetical protein